MGMNPRILLLAAATSLAGLAWLERPVEACGGCFVPTENNTVVTDHRMILSIDLQQSTLYDQIQYQGSPESFAWVLPIRGEAKVGVSADAVFAALDSQTSVQVIQPPRNCPAPTNCRSNEDLASSAGGSSSGGNAAPSVEVLKQETVGPYETVQLRSTDPEALRTWLTERGFQIPPVVSSIITSYVNEQFDFLAIKLVPGQGTQAMVPIRVTTRGGSSKLPLRMVAAGTGANVGITLWTIADGRWEAQNFPSFVVKETELSWDWITSSSNFKAMRAKHVSELGTASWENESSIALNVGTISSIVNQAQFRGNDGTSQYQAIKDANGKVIKTSEEVFVEDMTTLLNGSASNNSSRSVRVTRMRADLPQASLAADLSLQASADQSVLARTRIVTKESNQPTCPIYDGCKVVGEGPRDAAIASVDADGGLGGGACSTKRTHEGWLGGSFAVCAAGGLLIARRRVGRVGRGSRNTKSSR